MAENREPLLVKPQVYYHENCPGCKVDKRKANSPNIPFDYYFLVWIVGLSSALPISSIFPYLYCMVRDFNIAKREEDVSYYAGFIGCALLVGRFLTAVHWGMAADRFGRKPVMLISTMAVVIFNVMFGLSKNYWMAITARFLIGALNGLFGPLRAYSTELCRREHQALGLGMIASAWGIGLVVGPAIGGYLAQPAEKFPNVFSHDSIFGRFPYFLASLVMSVFALIVFFICFLLPETLHSHPADDDVEKLQSTEAQAETLGSWVSLLRNRPLMYIIILYAILQTHDLAYFEIFSLWSVSPRSLGGLGFSTTDVGQALAVAGISLLLCQLFLFPVLERYFGALLVSRGGVVLSIILLSCFPFFTNLTGTSLKLVVDLASALQNTIACSVLAGLFLLQNRAVCQQQRGAACGLSLCIVSLSTALGPAAAGTILSWCQTRLNASFLPGTHMAFFILNMIKFIGLVMTFKPFMVTPAREFD